ncbi:hypothetical protein SEVIR_2G282900v4 [Setaria viridis]|uniref:Uncharacterized protein n=2 Tax=Setaria TaxID=4554 RepID=K3ZRV0_SETIT|nr:uncharacterized protein LOC101756699 isoform X4 [Setaria italica]XP_034580301.1 uncharacterized protein LOC117843727 isoform X4 [Setaria viridis]RCV12471.1 hypothetical protein SETIT_2G272200v2 [Setaria italica]RCV12472.1 hypothetical protein SETIT_2G272200v2 [Setaria italica]RCV12473.1 hypothetical protein SETIT_2G272200v2 [Setaria italica]RCV12474.1 hypothetical protein SETIT_2G272200v2 [Setaria italica]RCV12475.1 hypothetical protein SETIT_2G272200v2 [Setaria italica]
MGYEESKNHLLSLSYQELQCLCKRYNLPAKKTHTQLASLLASLLEASPPAALTIPLATVKETATCDHVSNKRGPYNGRDDGRPPAQVKHQKGSQTPVDETTKGGIDTGTSISPVSINHGRPDCHGHSSSERGTDHNLQSQRDVGIASKSANPGLVSKHHRSPDNIIDQICPPIVEKYPEASTPFSHTEDTAVKGCGPSDKMSANAPAVQFSVMSDEGIDLVVDLNSTPASWAKTFMAEMCIAPPEHGNFSSFISSLATKDDHSTVSPSGNIIVDIQSKGAVNIIPSTNSSRASDVGENSRSVPYPADTITVNSVSSTSTLAGAPVELSGYQEGAPVVSSSCLTADVRNNVTSEPSALDNEVLPPESANVFMQPERITVPLDDASMQPTGNKVTMIPGGVVRSVSNEDSCPKSSGKQTADVPARVQLSHNDDVHETLMENGPVEAVAVEEDIGCGDSLSISCQLAGQTVAKLPVTDAQSHASSADHCVAGSFDQAHPTSSSAASDNAINSLTSKYGAESAQSHGSTDKNRVCGAEVLEELESMTPAVYSEPPRNIQLSLRSASAKKKPSTLPRRSARLIPK